MVVQETLEQYHANAAVGSSMLKVILESPKRYKAQFIDKTIESKESAALRFGSAIHLALLEPKAFKERYAIEPDLRRNTNLYKEWKQHVQEATPNAIIVSQSEMDNLLGMIDSVLSHTDASAMLRKGVAEHSVYCDVPVEVEVGGEIVTVKGKARPDFLHENGDLVEVKSCRDAGFRKFRNTVWEYRYDVSAAYHRELVEMHYGRRNRNFWWIALEKEPPYEVAVYRANDMVLDRGEADFRKALWRLATCTRSGQWPGKQEQAQDIDLPGYVQYE